MVGWGWLMQKSNALRIPTPLCLERVRFHTLWISSKQYVSSILAQFRVCALRDPDFHKPPLGEASLGPGPELCRPSRERTSPSRKTGPPGRLRAGRADGQGLERNLPWPSAATARCKINEERAEHGTQCGCVWSRDVSLGIANNLLPLDVVVRH